MNNLIKTILARLDFLPGRLLICFMPEGDRLLSCVYYHPHVFPNPLASHRPTFVQHSYLLHSINLANETDSPPGDRQPLRDQTTQGRSQTHSFYSASHLGRGLAFQAWGLIPPVIPSPKYWRFCAHLGQLSKCLARPETLYPKRVKAFYPVVAPAFVFGNEQRFYTNEQTQSYHFADNARVRMSSSKRIFVVHLFYYRNAQVGPTAQKMGAYGGTLLVWVLRHKNCVSVVIEGVKVLYYLSTVQVFGDDVGGVNSIWCPGNKLWVIGIVGNSATRMSQVVMRQDALNSCQGGQWFDAESLEFGSYCSMADKAITGFGALACFEQASYTDDHLLDRRGSLMR